MLEAEKAEADRQAAQRAHMAAGSAEEMAQRNAELEKQLQAEQHVGNAPRLGGGGRARQHGL